MKKEEEKTCRSCLHFKNHQMLLNYWDYLGFCINPDFAFNTSTGRFIGVVDEDNLRDRSKVSGNPSHDFETGSEFSLCLSTYHFQVSQDFGCKFHTKL